MIDSYGFTVSSSPLPFLCVILPSNATHTHTFNSPPLKMEKKKTGGNSTFENYSLNSEEEDEEEEEGRRAKKTFHQVHLQMLVTINAHTDRALWRRVCYDKFKFLVIHRHH